MRELERRVILSVLDRKWREHLYEMDYLREGIYLRAYSQRDPLVEYQREGFDMFAAVMDGIKEESVGFLFNLEVQVEEDDDEEDEEEFEPMRAELPTPGRRPGPVERRRGEPEPSVFEKPANVGREAADPRQGPRPAEAAAEPVVLRAVRAGRGRGGRRHRVNEDDEFADVGRNQLCPCGSGKKYKRCHGAPGGPTGLTARVS